ncbi:unnamed protein product, partial [Discosporangium mesarthrocarpum]
GAGVEGGEGRYKQQIAEMEAAMRSTWEEKARQSETSERERKRLQRKLEEEAEREERERKNRWKLLEDKGDLELSIREAGDALSPLLPVRDWLGRVKSLLGAEQRCREGSLACGVYEEALGRDLENLFAGNMSPRSPLGVADRSEQGLGQ